MQELSFQLATRPFCYRIFNLLLQMKNWEHQSCRLLRAENRALWDSLQWILIITHINKGGNRSKPSPGGWLNPVSFYLNVISQLAAISWTPAKEQTHTHKHKENLASTSSAILPWFACVFYALVGLMMECKVSAQWQTGVNSCRARTKQATNISIILTWFD